MSAPARRGPAGGRAPPQQVRIVGGSFKRSVLPVLDRPGLRPTPQRVRETLFNWLGQQLTGWSCLDAFAGTGALGFEAASRGAATVVLLERDPALVRALHAAQTRLHAHAVTIERADAVTWMGHAPAGRFDLVMLDPPFGDATLLRAAMEAATHLVKPDGLLYVEAGEPLAHPPDNFEPWRQDRAGAVCFHLLRRNSSS